MAPTHLLLPLQAICASGWWNFSADCVHSPTGLWLGSSLISNPVEVFPVFVRSLKQISWKYKLSHKPQRESGGKCFSTWLAWDGGEASTAIYTPLGQRCQKPPDNKNAYYVRGLLNGCTKHIMTVVDTIGLFVILQLNSFKMWISTSSGTMYETL